jgi:hypothetical protein
MFIRTSDGRSSASTTHRTLAATSVITAAVIRMAVSFTVSEMSSAHPIQSLRPDATICTSPERAA